MSTPVPPQAPSDPPTRSGRSGWWILMVLMLAVGVWAVVVSVLGGFARTDDRTVDFQEVSHIEFALDDAQVTVVAGDDDRVVVNQRARLGLLGGSATLDQDGDVLRIAQDCFWFLGFGCSGTYEVSVPRDVELSGGTRNGGLRIDGVHGTVDLVTSNGAIHLDFTTAPTTVTARTSNGRVEVGLPADAPAYQVTTETSNGTVTNDIRTDPGAAGTITLTTSNGDIRLFLHD